MKVYFYTFLGGLLSLSFTIATKLPSGGTEITIEDKQNPALSFMMESDICTLIWMKITKHIWGLNIYFTCPLTDNLELMEKEGKNAKTENSLFILNNEPTMDPNEQHFCNNHVTPSILQRRENEFTIGFEIYTGNKFYCLTSHWKLTLNENFCWFHMMYISYSSQWYPKYVYYTLSGKLDQNEETEPYDMNFGRKLIFNNEDIENYYSINNQSKVFSEAIENSEDRLKYFDPIKEKFLEKLFLAEPDNFYYKIHRKATYTFANVVPAWNSIKNGAWKHLNETLLKNLKENDSFAIITGTYGTLKLPNKIFLAEGNKIPVPLVFWQFIQYKVSDNWALSYHQIFILIHNNPYEEKPERLCTNVCSDFGWKEVYSENHQTGFTYCCKADEKTAELLGISNAIEQDSDVTQLVFDLDNYKIGVID